MNRFLQYRGYWSPYLARGRFGVGRIAGVAWANPFRVQPSHTYQTYQPRRTGGERKVKTPKKAVVPPAKREKRVRRAAEGAKTYNDTPNECDITQVVPGLYLGSEETLFDLNCLSQFKSVLNAVADDSKCQDCTAFYTKRGILYNRLGDFHDRPLKTKSDRKTFDEIVNHGADIVHDYFVRKRVPVLVHCLGGQNRSVSVIVAYLMKYRGYSFSDAAKLVENANILRPYSQTLTNRTFRDALKSLKF